MIEKNEESLRKYIGKILLCDNGIYKWMYKVVSVKNIKNHCTLYVTQGMDIYPQPRAYKHGESNSFNNVDTENISYGELREPTKEELNLYRKYSRELILLGTNKTDYGRNKDNRRT